MPDVTRSDSQRSDTSLRPRVSFNRDVHVKRIVPRVGRSLGALSGDGDGHLVKSPTRKEKLSKSKQELKEEAARVIHQVDNIDCVTKDKGVHPEKFYTLPARKKHRNNQDYAQSSLERPTHRRNSEELIPPKKPPRTFATNKPLTTQHSSIFNIFQKPEKEVKPKKSNLRRSVSDATNHKLSTDDGQSRKRRTTSENEEIIHLKSNKKQLSPIIEVTPREDYFAGTNLKTSPSFKENDKNVDNEIKTPSRKRDKTANTQSVTEKLKQYIDEVDTALYNESGNKKIPLKRGEQKKPDIFIIDVEQAEKISNKNKSKLTASAIAKKLRSITNKKVKTKTKEVIKNPAPVVTKPKVEPPPPPPLVDLKTSLVKNAIQTLENQNNKSPEMIHSSQKPVDKLPLTRGRAVDNMVKRLSHENSSPPPKTNVMVSPNVSVQHNNNQPFSYTRGVSPERNPIIYAQVVCGSNGSGTKQTVHTTYSNGKKHLPHSDSDEGLGYEENSGFRMSEKMTTHFGDDKYRSDIYNEERYNEEYPITPNFKNNGYNGFGYDNKYSKHDRGIFIDSSSRGRGDGMDAKRRESLTESNENGHHKTNGNNNLNSRKDLSARRDLLESRINRRFGDKSISSPEYSPNTNENVYISETTQYYRSGSASPIAFKEKFVSETRRDQNDQKYTTNTRTKNYLNENHDGYNKMDDYRYSYDNEPKSFDSQLSDYRSSPENIKHFETSQKTKHLNKYTSKADKQQLSKDRKYYKSNPEINQRNYHYERQFQDSYHDSLKREKHEHLPSESHNGQYFDHNESERKDRFVDSGIENDFRRDSGERRFRRRELSNESEDEGFASSLLIASERQHTEDSFARKNRRGYDSDRDYNNRNIESMEYRNYRSKQDYIPRERSIDDGSHFDPRIDKNMDNRSTLKKMDKKPPKPEKRSSLEKMKQLFTGGRKKKEKPGMVREDSLRARYTEYKGNHVEPKVYRKEVSESNTGYDYNSRRRLSTPSPSPTRELQRNGKTASTHGSWFKSIDRLSRKKSKKDDKEGNMTSTEDEVSKPTKSLRFFGDTDIESNDSIRHKSALKSRSGLSNRDRNRSQSSRDLHNISEETHKTSHKSMLNLAGDAERDVKGSRISLKPPASPSHRNNRELSRSREDRSRRRKNEVSSIESSTEGDSSQQSQRSIVYLHAATVGDIPGPGYLKNVRRAASREELTSNSSSRIQPQVKTLSRSFSVLAPWKPRHYREGMDIDYTQYPKVTKNGKYEQNKNGSSRKESSSTLKKKAQETRRSNQNMSTLNKKSRSKENISTLKRANESKGSSLSLYKKKERQPKEHNRYNRDDKRMATKSMSVESLGSRQGRKGDREVSRSISMPRDPEKSAGWFTMNKKSKKSVSTQRL